MNELALIVVNDGNGDQCGYSYRDRLEAARQPYRASREVSYACMVCNVLDWMRQHEMEPGDASVVEAIEELEAYYQQHLAEGA